MNFLGSILLVWTLASSFLQLGSTPIWVPLTIILILILIFWWGMTRNQINDETTTEDLPGVEESAHTEVVEADPEEVAVEEGDGVEESSEELQSEPVIQADDLKLIEGIGPKISAVLADAGILTFAQLANSDAATLTKIVREDASLKLADPSSWPEQARLAADGNWDELEKLQEELHAGRQV
ncbi:MAG: helix-hairpin-helix domain-containing protein [Candidatus Promineifilaceae bacterium]|nr:helix-hairpin-helix domain-containing protein [Candidatus Promineifilaceae bacterium]